MRKVNELALRSARVVAVLALLSAPAHAQQSGPRVQAQEGIAIIGNVGSGSTLIVGTPADKLKEIVAASSRDWQNLTDSQRLELADLQRQLGVTEGALQTFFAVLGERNVPPEQLAAKLGEIAGRFKETQRGVGEIPASSPEVAALKVQAEAALEQGQLDEADQLLASMQEIQRRDVSGLLADLSETAAQRGNIAMTELRYVGAARQFEEAARFAPDEETRIEYLWFQALALSRDGSEFGNNESLKTAISAWQELGTPEMRTRNATAWASFQNNLAATLISLGYREPGAARLEEAVAASRAALEEYTRERAPLEWATTQNNLGSALRLLGEREAGTERLEQAVAAYRAALEEQTRDEVPLDWAMTQTNLADTLVRLGLREDGVERLRDAVDASRTVLTVVPRDRDPLGWASAQNSLGDALHHLSHREPETVSMEEAVAAYRAALEERTRDRVPLDWASTQASLATVLSHLGENEAGTERLVEAVAAFRSALEEATRERLPLNWALTQNDLGDALKTLGERELGTARLEEAVAAYRAALEERTRDRVPVDWAETTLSKCLAEALIAERQQQPARLDGLEQEAGEAREVLVDGGHAQWVDWGDYVLREIARIRAALGEQ